MKYIYCNLVWMVLISSCEKQGQNNMDCNSSEILVVGQTCIFFELNDTLGLQRYDSLEYDLSSNSSVRFRYFYGRYMASTLETYRTKIRTIGDCEILIDTSLQMKIDTPDTIFTHIPMPLILNLNDTIDKAGNWSNSELTIISYTQKLWRDSTGFTKLGITYFPGWNKLGEKYFAFREFHSSDTTYGIFKIDVQNSLNYIKGWGTY